MKKFNKGYEKILWKKEKKREERQKKLELRKNIKNQRRAFRKRTKGSSFYSSALSWKERRRRKGLLIVYEKGENNRNIGNPFLLVEEIGGIFQKRGLKYKIEKIIEKVLFNIKKKLKNIKKEGRSIGWIIYKGEKGKEKNYIKEKNKEINSFLEKEKGAKRSVFFLPPREEKNEKETDKKEKVEEGEEKGDMDRFFFSFIKRMKRRIKGKKEFQVYNKKGKEAGSKGKVFGVLSQSLLNRFFFFFIFRKKKEGVYTPSYFSKKKREQQPLKNEIDKKKYKNIIKKRSIEDKPPIKFFKEEEKKRINLLTFEKEVRLKPRRVLFFFLKKTALYENIKNKKIRVKLERASLKGYFYNQLRIQLRKGGFLKRKGIEKKKKVKPNKKKINKKKKYIYIKKKIFLFIYLFLKKIKKGPREPSNKNGITTTKGKKGYKTSFFNFQKKLFSSNKGYRVGQPSYGRKIGNPILKDLFFFDQKIFPKSFIWTTLPSFFFFHKENKEASYFCDNEENKIKNIKKYIKKKRFQSLEKFTFNRPYICSIYYSLKEIKNIKSHILFDIKKNKELENKNIEKYLISSLTPKITPQLKKLKKQVKITWKDGSKVEEKNIKNIKNIKRIKRIKRELPSFIEGTIYNKIFLEKVYPSVNFGALKSRPLGGKKDIILPFEKKVFKYIQSLLIPKKEKQVITLFEKEYKYLNLNDILIELLSNLHTFLPSKKLIKSKKIAYKGTRKKTFYYLYRSSIFNIRKEVIFPSHIKKWFKESLLYKNGGAYPSKKSKTENPSKKTSIPFLKKFESELLSLLFNKNSYILLKNNEYLSLLSSSTPF